jgi:hypothetical protein
MTFAHDNRVEAEPNADGTNDTRWPNGDKPVSGTGLTVDAAKYAALGSFLSLPINQSARFNLRSVLGGSEKATAVLSLVTISGVDAATHGWSIDVDDLVFNSGSASAGGVLEAIATPAHGDPVLFPQTAWSSADPTADLMAPTVPTGVGLTPAVGAIDLTWDTSGDGYDGSTAGSGVDHYNVYQTSVASANKLSPPSPVASPSAAAMPRLTTSNIGGFSPAPSVTQNKQTWTVTASGLGFNGVTADQCEFVGAQQSGDQSIQLAVAAFAGTGFAGVMVRETRAPNAVFIAFCLLPGGGLVGISRDATGAASATFLTVPGIVGPVRLRAIRSGSTWTVLYSSDGGRWKVGGTKTLAMAQVCEWGAGVASAVAGTPITAVITDINLTGSGSVTARVITTTPKSLCITAIDKIGNESGPSILILGSPLTIAGSGRINHRPGIRARIGGYGGMVSLALLKAACDQFWGTPAKNYTDGLDVNNRILGISISPTLADLESATLGIYDGLNLSAEQGDTKIQAIINLLKTYPGNKDCQVLINCAGNGFSPQTSTGFLNHFAPAYMNTAFYDFGEGHMLADGTPETPRLKYWNINVANRVNACVAHLYNRFGADIYGCDALQEISNIEGMGGYTFSKLVSVWPAFCAGFRAAAPTWHLFLKPTSINPVATGASYPTILREMRNNFITMGQEDTTDKTVDSGARAYLGLYPGFCEIDYTKSNNGSPGWDFHCNVDPSELFWDRPASKLNDPGALSGTGRLYDMSPTYPGIWTRVNSMKGSHVDIYVDAYGGYNVNGRTFRSNAPPNPTPGPGAGLVAAHPNLIDVLGENTKYAGVVPGGCAMPWIAYPFGYPQ